MMNMTKIATNRTLGNCCVIFSLQASRTYKNMFGYLGPEDLGKPSFYLNTRRKGSTTINSGGSKGGARDTPPPAQNFLISCSFWQKLAK